MKKFLGLIICLIALAVMAGVVQSPWTTTSNRQTALNAICGAASSGDTLQYNGVNWTAAASGSVKFKPDQFATNGAGQIILPNTVQTTNLYARGLVVNSSFLMQSGSFSFTPPRAVSSATVTLSHTDVVVIDTSGASELYLPPTSTSSAGETFFVSFQGGASDLFVYDSDDLANQIFEIGDDGSASRSSPVWLMFLNDGTKWNIVAQSGFHEI